MNSQRKPEGVRRSWQWNQGTLGARLLLFHLFCLSFPMGLLCSGFSAEVVRPNFLVILADDLGFSDLGCYGGEIRTPNLDRLAAGGVRFTQFYNTGRCWPTRAAFLSGYYPQAIRRDLLPEVNGGKLGPRPKWAKLLPEYLRSAGYRSYHSGKWHVDGPVLAAGFDHSYSLEDHDRNFYPKDHRLDDRPLPAVKRGEDYYTSTAIADHAVEFLREHASEHSGQPFFQYLAFTSPHFPLQASQEDIGRYAGQYGEGWDVIRERRMSNLNRLGIVSGRLPALEPEVVPAWNLSEADLKAKVGNGEVGRAIPWITLDQEQRSFQAMKMEVHAAMVDRMDQEIGKVLQQIRAMGCWSNTVVVFLSDNGASAEQIIRGDGHDPKASMGSGETFLGLGPGWSSAANAPLRKHKSWVHEGGIATPLIVHWPQGLRERGALKKTVGHVVDWVPTLLELAGLRDETIQAVKGESAPPWHGRSLVAALNSRKDVPFQSFWWNHEKHRAIRVGDWKLVSSYDVKQQRDGPWELYRISRDRQELKDLAGRKPEKVKELAAEWDRRKVEFIRQAKLK